MKEKKYSERVQKEIDLLKSAVAEEAKKASKKEIDLSLEKPKWNRINYEVKSVDKVLDFNNIEVRNLDLDGIKVSNDVFTKLRLSNYFKNQSEQYSNFKKNIVIEKSIEEKIYLIFELDNKNPHLVDVLNIELKENTKAKIYVLYKGIDESDTYHNGYINVKANKGSKLDIFVIQTLNLNSENFLGMDIDVCQDAEVNYYGAEFGGNVNVTSVSSNLLENRSKSLLLPIYFADKERKNDFEYTLNFFGKEAIADIDARGVTKDRATKVFRGNLVFERFSSKSEGSESEFAILLDKTVKSHSIPTLFCDEDDVIGAHSANIGKIDQDKLFYLMSRGLDEKSAKKLVVESSFGTLFDALDDEEIVRDIKDILERRL